MDSVFFFSYLSEQQGLEWDSRSSVTNAALAVLVVSPEREGGTGADPADPAVPLPPDPGSAQRVVPPALSCPLLVFNRSRVSVIAR